MTSRRCCVANAAVSNLRMIAAEFRERQFGCRRRGRVQADKQGTVRIDALQQVGPVGDCDLTAWFTAPVGAQKIPRGPGALALWHQSKVAVQIGRVRPVLDRAEDVTLLGGPA